jgi:hypothetical protein
MAVWKPKLEPLQMLTLAETRRTGKRDGVSEPERKPSRRCWANVPRYLEGYDNCKNRQRKGYLTCVVHYTRELAARELKCETEGVAMNDIAYTYEADRKAHIEEFRASLQRN